MSEYFVDPSLAGNVGTGLISDPFGDFRFALDSVMSSPGQGVDGDTFHIKSGTAEVVGSTYYTGLTYIPTVAKYLIIRGYDTAAYDGGIGEFSTADTNRIMEPQGFVAAVDMKYTDLNNTCRTCESVSSMHFNVESTGKALSDESCTIAYSRFGAQISADRNTLVYRCLFDYASSSTDTAYYGCIARGTTTASGIVAGTWSCPIIRCTITNRANSHRSGIAYPTYAGKPGLMFCDNIITGWTGTDNNYNQGGHSISSPWLLGYDSSYGCTGMLGNVCYNNLDDTPDNGSFSFAIEGTVEAASDPLLDSANDRFEPTAVVWRHSFPNIANPQLSTTAVYPTLYINSPMVYWGEAGALQKDDVFSAGWAYTKIVPVLTARTFRLLQSNGDLLTQSNGDNIILRH